MLKLLLHKSRAAFPLAIQAKTFLKQDSRFIFSPSKLILKTSFSELTMGGKHKRARFANQNSKPPEEIVTARKQIIEARKNVDVSAALQIYNRLCDSDFTIPVDLATMVLSVLSDSPDLDIPNVLQEATNLYETTKEGSSTPPSEAFFSTATRVFSRLNDIDTALKVIKEMKEAGHSPRHRTYSPLLNAACKSSKLKLARSVFQDMLASQSSDKFFEDDASIVLEVCSAVSDGEDSLSESEKIEWIEQILRDCSKRSTELPSPRLIEAAKLWFKADPTTIAKPLDSENRCEKCGSKMKSLEPNEEELALILKQTEDLAPIQKPEKLADWERFLAWESRNLSKFDTVVDGANIAHFRSNTTSGNSEPKYNQVDVIMKKLRERGRKPILFFHTTHFKKPAIRELEMKWKADNCLYVVPHGHNDDIFWLHMSLKMGTRCWLVTNDQMRDHKFEMMQSSYSFARWRERHQVPYDVVWIESERQVHGNIYPPLRYSVQVQCSESGHWHFPVQVPLTDDEQRLADEKQKLKELSPEELRKRKEEGKISFELFREIRREALGCELPKTHGKRYEWYCF